MLGIAISIHLALVPALSVLPAHGHHQLVGLHRRFRLVLLTVDIRQPVEEDGAVVLLRIRVLAVWMGGLLNELLQDLRGFVVVAERVLDQRFVEADLQRS